MASDKIRNKITLSLTSYQLADDDLQYAFCLINPNLPIKESAFVI